MITLSCRLSCYLSDYTKSQVFDQYNKKVQEINKNLSIIPKYDNIYSVKND